MARIPTPILHGAYSPLHAFMEGSMGEVPKFDRQRVEEAAGFELRGIVFAFTPTGSPDLYAAAWNADVDAEHLAGLDAFIKSTLVGESRDDWEHLRDQANPPLWFDEIQQVSRHIAAVTAARPTMPSNGSSPTATASGTGSTVASPSTEAALSPA